MNEQNLNTTPPPAVEPVVPPAPKPKVFDLVKETLRKFYSNKRLFRIFVAIFGTMIVIIVAGLIFSLLRNRGGSETLTSPTPEPTMASEIQRTNENEVKLKNLKERIINLDIYQKRLSPPTINFDISF